MSHMVRETDRFIIYDDLLPPEDFLRLVGDIQRIRYHYPDKEWHKLWSFSDPPTVSSDAFHWSRKPFGFGLDQVTSVIHECLENSKDRGLLKISWMDVGFRIYMQPVGSRLNCHSDTPIYVGAAVYYAHEDWRPNWGGELVFPNVNDSLENDSNELSNGPIFNKKMERKLMESFCGEYVSPKPNRLVVIRPGALHYTNRVDSSAGSNIRVSISSFLLRETISKLNNSFEIG